MEAILQDEVRELGQRRKKLPPPVDDFDLMLDEDGHVGLPLDLKTLDSALAWLTAKEEALDAKLATMCEENAAAAAAELPELQAHGQALAATGKELDALAADLAASSSAAASSCAELRALIEEQQRLTEQMRMAEELLSLEQCAGDVDAALSRGDYATAVARVAPLARAIAATESEAGEVKPAAPAVHVDGKRAAEVVASLRQRVSTDLKTAAETYAIAHRTEDLAI